VTGSRCNRPNCRNTHFALLLCGKIDIARPSRRIEIRNRAAVMVPLVYSPAYNITAFGLERLHPFDSRKYRRIHDWLIRQGLRRRGEFVTPQPCSRADLLRIHTPDYLRSLRDRRVLARILEVPVVRYLPACLTARRV